VEWKSCGAVALHTPHFETASWRLGGMEARLSERGGTYYLHNQTHYSHVG
jgi:hypothetical protein